MSVSKSQLVKTLEDLLREINYRGNSIASNCPAKHRAQDVIDTYHKEHKK